MSITARRNSVKHSPCRLYMRQRRISCTLLFLVAIATTTAHADGEITELKTSTTTATPSTIVADGVSYQWGQGVNLQLDGFYLESDEYVPNLKANSVSVQRRDIPGVAIGELCGVFAERRGSTVTDLEPDFPALVDHAGICDMSAMLMSSVINRGTLDTFANTGANPNNIERIDYHFDGGISAPSEPAKMSSAGHIVGEKHGNNIIQIAAILAMDDSGNPAQYGPLISIDGLGMCTTGGICYGETSQIHDYAFFKSPSLEPLNDLQAVARITEPVTFAFLSMETLGIPVGGIYYGVSLFPHDVDANVHNLLDISSFPEDSGEPESRPEDSADIYGGSAFLYVKPTGVITGRVFCQADGGATAPKPNVPVSLFRDTIADGVLDELQDQRIANLPGTTMDGQYSFLGLENGSYFVVVADRADEESASLAVVINDSPVDGADIVLDEPCQRVGPIAFPDTETLTSSSVSIAVLENDKNAAGENDAAELRITSVSESNTAALNIEGRSVLYIPSEALKNSATLDNPAIDVFTYTIADDQGLISEATVTVTILPGGDGSLNCLEQGRTDCLFVETEVDGIGRTPLLVCLLLLTFVVIRRCALLAASPGEKS